MNKNMKEYPIVLSEFSTNLKHILGFTEVSEVGYGTKEVEEYVAVHYPRKSSERGRTAKILFKFPLTDKGADLQDVLFRFAKRQAIVMFYSYFEAVVKEVASRIVKKIWSKSEKAGGISAADKIFKSQIDSICYRSNVLGLIKWMNSDLDLSIDYMEFSKKVEWEMKRGAKQIKYGVTVDLKTINEWRNDIVHFNKEVFPGHFQVEEIHYYLLELGNKIIEAAKSKYDIVMD